MNLKERTARRAQNNDRYKGANEIAPFYAVTREDVDMSIIEIIKQLSSGMGITIEIFFVTLVTSLILGLGLALGPYVQN